MKYNRIDQVFTMTEMTVDKGYFANREEVLQDIIGYLTSSQGAKFHGGDD